MKSIFFFLSIFFVKPFLAQSITYIEVNYIPWSITTKGKFSEGNLRELENSHSVRFTSDSVLIEFEKSMLITNFTKTKLTQLDTRMIIDVFYNEGYKKTFLVSYDPFMKGPGMIKYANYYFKNNQKLNLWINTFIPFKYTLKGEFVEIKAKEGEYTEIEIKELKDKGIIIKL